MNTNRILGIFIAITVLTWILVFALSPQPKYQKSSNINIPKLPEPLVDQGSLKKIEFKETEYIPGLFNIFNEILVNSKDQVTRLNELYKNYKNIDKVTEIKVEIKPEKGEISIMNNGDGIDIA